MLEEELVKCGMGCRRRKDEFKAAQRDVRRGSVLLFVWVDWSDIHKFILHPSHRVFIYSGVGVAEH